MLVQSRAGHAGHAGRSFSRDKDIIHGATYSLVSGLHHLSNEWAKEKSLRRWAVENTSTYRVFIEAMIAIIRSPFVQG